MATCEKLRKVEKKLGKHERCLAICAGKDCARAGAKHIIRAGRAALDEAELSDEVRIVLTKCQDHCKNAPALTLLPGPFPYIKLTPADVQTIVTEHVLHGKPVRDLLHKRARKRLKKLKKAKR